MTTPAMGVHRQRPRPISAASANRRIGPIGIVGTVTLVVRKRVDIPAAAISRPSTVSVLLRDKGFRLFIV